MAIYDKSQKGFIKFLKRYSNNELNLGSGDSGQQESSSNISASKMNQAAIIDFNNHPLMEDVDVKNINRLMYSAIKSCSPKVGNLLPVFNLPVLKQTSEDSVVIDLQNSEAGYYPPDLTIEEVKNDLSFRWFLMGTEQAGETNYNFALPTDNSYRGKVLQAEVTDVENNVTISNYFRINSSSSSPTTPIFQTIFIKQIINKIEVDLDNSLAEFFPINLTVQDMINNGDVSFKWFMDGVEVVGETNASLSLDYNNGNHGKSVYAEVTNNVDASVVTSNSLVFEEIWIPDPSALYMWFDPKDQTTLTLNTDDSVLTWTNKGTSSINLQEQSSGVSPIYDPSTELYPTIHFPSNRKTLKFSSRTSGRVIFLAAKITNTSSWLLGDTSNYNFHAGNIFSSKYAQSSVLNATCYKTGKEYLGSEIKWTIDEWEIYSFRLSSSTSFNTLSQDRNWSYSSGTLYGWIGELIITDNLIDIDFHEKIEGYLAHIFNVAYKLPANHPYKTTAP